MASSSSLSARSFVVVNYFNVLAAADEELGANIEIIDISCASIRSSNKQQRRNEKPIISLLWVTLTVTVADKWRSFILIQDLNRNWIFAFMAILIMPCTCKISTLLHLHLLLNFEIKADFPLNPEDQSHFLARHKN